MDAHARHQHYIQNYVLFYRGRGQQSLATAKARAQPDQYETEADVIRRNHKFLHQEPESLEKQPQHLTPAQRWEAQLARAYYDRLFKEYALCDLSRYKSGQIALRWRVEREVLDGKGQWTCGNVACSKSKRLKSWEVPFKYREDGVDKHALVKVRLCRKCGKRLHYKKEQERKAERRQSRGGRLRSGRGNDASGTESSESSDEDAGDAPMPPPARQEGGRRQQQGHSSHATERERSPHTCAAASSPLVDVREERDRDRPISGSASNRNRLVPSQADLDHAFAGLFE